jgi:hypothetical protein
LPGCDAAGEAISSIVPEGRGQKEHPKWAMTHCRGFLQESNHQTRINEQKKPASDEVGTALQHLKNQHMKMKKSMGTKWNKGASPAHSYLVASDAFALAFYAGSPPPRRGRVSVKAFSLSFHVISFPSHPYLFLSFPVRDFIPCPFISCAHVI